MTEEELRAIEERAEWAGTRKPLFQLAKEDVPALCAEVRRLQSLLAYVEAEIHNTILDIRRKMREGAEH